MKVRIPGSEFQLLDVVHLGLFGFLAAAGLVGLLVLPGVWWWRHRKSPSSVSMRSRLAKLGVSGAALAVGMCGLLWTSNTTVPDFDWTADPVTASAGDTVLLQTDESCGLSDQVVYKANLFGRWQRTHRSGEADKRRWNDTAGEESAYPLACQITDNGEVSFKIPETVEPGTLALCGIGQSCAKVKIVSGD